MYSNGTLRSIKKGIVDIIVMMLASLRLLIFGGPLYSGHGQFIQAGHAVGVYGGRY
ncbi:MAG: hypothetical protein ACXAEX_01495 [Promethearchaeota archaeon]